MRTVPEWIGKTDDEAIPPRVKARVFERHGGKDYLTGKKIMPGDAWDCDHIIAICNGGSNRESNLAPLLKAKHKEKTADDLAIKSKIERTRKKFLGIYPPSPTPLRSRGFSKRYTAEVDPDT
jgi:5-methylcytosine-specific restriction protein A